MQSKKIDGPADARIGGAPPPMTRSQKLIEQILELQQQIRGLERELQRAHEAESLVSLSQEVPSDYPG